MLFKRIEEIEAWKRGCRLTVDVYQLSSKGQLDRDWGLKDQIRRAAVSIPSNIAEGFERNSVAEFRRFALIAKGSCGELRTHLYIVQALEYLDKTEIEPLIQECSELSAMIAGLIRSLESKQKTGTR